jgi:lysophospholipase L1-like esterase
MQNRYRLPCPKCLIILLLVYIAVIFAGVCRADDILVHPGQKVAFLGDSITSNGWDFPLGYVHLVVTGLETNGIKIDPIPAGVSGNRSCDMLVRIDNDVISKKPDWMTISCGVNDVWHNPGGIPLDQYKTNIAQIVDKGQAAGIKIVILTSTLIFEDPKNDFNQRAIPYNEFLRQLAQERHFPLADLNADEQAELTKAAADGWKPGHLLTMDGVHPNPRGNVMMAMGILKAFGLSDAQIDKANDVWLDIPHGYSANLTYQMTVNKTLTLRQYLALQDATPKDNGNVLDLLQTFCNTAFPAVLAAEGKDGIENLKKKALDKIDQDVDQKLKQ